MIDQYINYANALALAIIAAYVIVQPQVKPPYSHLILGITGAALVWLAVQALFV